MIKSKDLRHPGLPPYASRRCQIIIQRTKAATKLPTIAVGLITAFEQAEAIISTGDADFVALARAILYNPRWPWHAAAHFGASVRAPKQYLRSQPHRFRDLFRDSGSGEQLRS